MATNIITISMFIVDRLLLDTDDDDNDETEWNLKTQQTPNEEAQDPLAVPPLAVHSLELEVGSAIKLHLIKLHFLGADGDFDEKFNSIFSDDGDYKEQKWGQ